MKEIQLILVQGIPGTGKTTLATRLSGDLHIPLIGKDDIKEVFYDRLGSYGLPWSKALGAVASRAMYDLAATLIPTGRRFMLESAFFTEFARPALQEVLAQHPTGCLELYCTTNAEIRRQRFIDRNESGERHPGHGDTDHYQRLSGDVTGTYAPLHVGDYLEVDTTQFGDSQYQQLLAALKDQYGISGPS